MGKWATSHAWPRRAARRRHARVHRQPSRLLSGAAESRGRRQGPGAVARAPPQPWSQNHGRNGALPQRRPWGRQQGRVLVHRLPPRCERHVRRDVD